ncbi:MAG: tRNA glutamyl-Q(34) synthetase GluQRS [Deltaproteobacteria bacterium]|nr:tRNA glutamyl-Q(34) synthetase GluQRS [Deltaproteobacteria bacterium]
MITTTRFAPSPSGALHLGHAYAAIFAHDLAVRAGGRFLVRIEDIDRGRCRREHEEAIFADLEWLGLSWEKPVRRQSEHFDGYRRACQSLAELGVLYPCFCTRKDIAAEIASSPSAPHGPDGPLYPGICRRLEPAERERLRASGQPYALRLDVAAAGKRAGDELRFEELGGGPDSGVVVARPEELGDVVIARKDVGTSYHLAVTVDDALQQVTDVSRGRDLFHATHIHRLLQALLELPTPRYHHHDLVRGEDGQRLATRDKALALAALRSAGTSPAQIRARLGLEAP